MAVMDYLVAQALRLHRPGLAVLDLGCGDGRAVRALHDVLSVPVYGHDLPAAEARCRHAMRGHPLERQFEALFSFAPAGEAIGREEGSCGLILCNQVVEHVEDLDGFFESAARVLHPSGRMLCVFPSIHHLVEAHTRVPLAHRIPPGRARRALIDGCHRWLGRPHRRGQEEVGTFWDQWLEKNTFYRTESQVRDVAARHFRQIRDDARQYGSSVFGAFPLRFAPFLRHLSHRWLNCTLVLAEPRAPESVRPASMVFA